MTRARRSTRSPGSAATCASRSTSTDGVVADAWSSGTMFRGLELILRGPRPARRLALRPAHLRHLHGRPRARLGAGRRERPRRDDPAERPPDPQPHRRDAVRPGPRRPLLPPARARLGRPRRRPSRADPAATSNLARSTSGWPQASAALLPGGPGPPRSGSSSSGQPGPFANGHWGHPAYRLSRRGEPARDRPLPRGPRLAARAIIADPHAPGRARTRTRRPSWSAGWR